MVAQPPETRAACLATDWPGAPDWGAPWYAPWRRVARAVLAGCDAGLPAHAAANALGGAPVRFVPADAAPPGVAYESYIFESACVPTRAGWHDFFNAMVWLRLPRTKRRLNALQAAEIARDGVQARRGPVRDAITVFDENAALLHAPDALWQALAERRWSDLFGPLRPLWAEATLLMFGHAALEKLVAPYKSITVHVWRVGLPFDPAGDLAALDDWLARDLSADRLAAKPFAPLPVLGVPGWWPANEVPGFYADTSVFRLPRARRSEENRPDVGTASQ